jgi:parallel beta-helix repeat protein
MKRKLLFLVAGVCTLYSCSKTEITPKSDLATSSTSVHFVTNSRAETSYTATGPINLNGSHDITISGKSINGGSVPAITLSNCYNVHITQNSLGNSSDAAIYLYHCYNITIDYNFITNVSTGVYVDHPTGGGTVINNNQFLNMHGPFPRGQFVQFNTVNGAGNQIEYNRCENILGQSSSQEGINLYMSNGTPSSPIQVVGNLIRGGGPGNASGGIQLGDSGGSYQTASDNIMVNPGQMGLSISGGDHMSFINNTVYSDAQYFSNVGVVVWGQAGSTVTNSTVSGNKVKFKNASNVENDNWIAPGNPSPSGWDSNSWNAGIDASVLPASLISPAAATAPLQAAGVTTTTAAAVTSSSSPAGSPIAINGRSNFTLSNLTIVGGSVPCIKLTNCSNVYITACVLNASTDVGILLDNCTNVTIEKNNIFNVAAGIVATNCPGNINIFTNQMGNMQGQSHGGAFVQFINVTGTNNNISYNKLQNVFGQSNTEHAIDIASSNGASSSPITIDQNWIRGGGPNNSGGGIMLGDGGGSNQIAKNNILADPGQFGLAIAGGSSISLINNTVYAKQQSFTNVGLYVWGQGGHTISNSTVSGNQINFTNSSGYANGNWLASGEATPSGWNSNNWGANIDESVLPTTIVSF